MDIQIIKTDAQYQEILAEVGRLAEIDPPLDTPDGARLELLAKLVEDYEKEQFVFAQPDPVDAILFRMEEQGLRQADVAPLFGGRNRASEVLARKRPLTLTMIRALHDKLDIPAALLVREPSADYNAGTGFDEADIPLTLLRKRGWIEAGVTAKQFLTRLMAPSASPVLFRHTQVFGNGARTNPVHIQLWLARVREVAASRHYLRGRYRKETLNRETLAYIARLSWMEDGPRAAMNFLADRGIALVIEPHLPSTRLDGAAMIGRDGAPVIGMTIRHDRLDNFWFTLMHELVHAWKHLDDTEQRAIADENIEKPPTKIAGIEREANDLAAEIFVDRATWNRSRAHLNPSVESIRELANRLQISPAIIAGRIRYERRNYAVFPKLVGYHTVRGLFPEVNWP